MHMKNLKTTRKAAKSSKGVKEILIPLDLEAANQNVSDEMTRIIHDYKEQNNIDCITEEELTDIFGESFLPPDLYFPYGEDFFVEITYYDEYMLNQGINPFEGWEFTVIQEYLDTLIQTEDGIDLGDVDQLSENDEFMDLSENEYCPYWSYSDYPVISETHFWKQNEKEMEIEMMKELCYMGDADSLNEGEWECLLEEELEHYLSLRTKTIEVNVTDFADFSHWLYRGMEETTYLLKIHWNTGDRKFLIKVSDEEQFYFYQVILEFDCNNGKSSLYLGSDTWLSSVWGIIDYYLETGNSTEGN
jgi:hypothetical protein